MATRQVIKLDERKIKNDADTVPESETIKHTFDLRSVYFDLNKIKAVKKKLNFGDSKQDMKVIITTGGYGIFLTSLQYKYIKATLLNTLSNDVA